jgi:hypothetical protein
VGGGECLSNDWPRGRSGTGKMTWRVGQLGEEGKWAQAKSIVLISIYSKIFICLKIEMVQRMSSRAKKIKIKYEFVGN